MTIIPLQYKLAAGGAALVLALAGAAATGAVANGWRLDAAHQRVLASQKQEYDTLAAKVSEQNLAVAVLGAEKRAADQARQVAEKFAAAAIARTQSRGAAVAASQAPDCDGVMREAWAGWK